MQHQFLVLMASSSCSSWRPWIWAIETLASNHSHTSLLFDLLKKIPEGNLETDGNKKSSLFKCTLKQLKDVILKDKHSLPSSLKERSGLLNQENDCKQMIVYNAYYTNFSAATKRKRDASSSGSFRESRHVEDVSGGLIQGSGRADSDLLKEPLVEMESFKDDFSFDNVDYDCVELKRLKVSSAVDDHQREISSCDDACHDKNGDIIVKSDTLLNSQYSPSQDSLATVNGTKQQLCMICKLGSHLLVCSSRSCRRVIHERCLGVTPTFDARRSFYCPFCAYSRTVSEYSDRKKNYSLAKKALVAFLRQDEYRLRNSSNILVRADQNQLSKTQVLDKCVEHNSLENVVSRVNETRSRIDMEDKPLVSSHLIPREWGRVLSCGGNKVDKRQAERSGRSACCQSPREQEQQVSVLGLQNSEAYNLMHGGSEQLSVVEKLQEVLRQSNGVTLLKKNEQNIASRAGQDSKVCNSSCKDLSISHGSEQHTGSKREQNVSSQPHVVPWEPAKPPCYDVEGSSRGKDDKSFTFCHSLRVRKQEQQYPYPSIPQMRRKKVSWSTAEEEALKEGVRRFASDHNRTMPWKKILEFGAKIFEKHRTAIDLKDKWRNICKGSPKV